MTKTKTLQPEISASHLEIIRKSYNETDANFILQMLDENELLAIDNTEGMSPEDYIFIARANRIVRDRPDITRRYDKFMPRDMFASDYRLSQRKWFAHKQRALTKELQYEPKTDDLLADAELHKDPIRFKVFYCLKNPKRVRLRERQETKRAA